MELTRRDLLKAGVAATAAPLVASLPSSGRASENPTDSDSVRPDDGEDWCLENILGNLWLPKKDRLSKGVANHLYFVAGNCRTHMPMPQEFRASQDGWFYEEWHREPVMLLTGWSAIAFLGFRGFITGLSAGYLWMGSERRELKVVNISVQNLPHEMGQPNLVVFVRFEKLPETA